VTLREVYDAILSRNRNAQVVVIYLCNDPANCRREPLTMQAADSVANVRSTSVNELLAPARALLHTRDARASLARAQLRDTLKASFIQLNVCADGVSLPPIAGSRSLSSDTNDVAKARQRAVTPPLGWLLSEIARRWMDGSISRKPRVGDGSCRLDNLAQLAHIDTLRARRTIPEATPAVMKAP
jgi:hypothetical protein